MTTVYDNLGHRLNEVEKRLLSDSKHSLDELDELLNEIGDVQNKLAVMHNFSSDMAVEVSKRIMAITNERENKN